MIGVNVNSLPYQQKINYKMIKYIRLSRNLTQSQFGEICKIDQSVLAKLERNELDLTIHYESKIWHGMKALDISEYELNAIRTLADHKK